MGTFLEIERADGKTVYLNVAQIAVIESISGGYTIHTTSGKHPEFEIDSHQATALLSEVKLVKIA